MAEINQLLEQATEEAAALTSDASRLREVVSRLSVSAASLEESLERGAGETQRLIDTLTVRMDEAEEELGREAATAVASLAGVESAAHDTLSESHDLLARVHEDLGALRGERERLAEELDQQAETTRTAAARYGKQARDVHAQAEDRLAQLERTVVLLRGQAEETRDAVAERREVLLAEARTFEARLRSDLRQVLHLYDTVATGLEAQLRQLQASAQSLSEQVGARLERKLSQDALDGLSQAASPLRDVLGALERFADRSRDRASGRLSEVTVAVEDVARVLDRMRPPLDLVKQYLR
jgi:regulator of replication initiation timing